MFLGAKKNMNNSPELKLIKRLKSYTRAFACIRRKESFCIRTPIKCVYIFTYDKNSSKWILNISNLDEKIDKDDPCTEDGVKAFIHRIFCNWPEGSILILSRRQPPINIFSIIRTVKRINAEKKNILKSIFSYETE